MTTLHVEIPYSLGKSYLDFLSLRGYLLGWGLVRSIEKRSSFELSGLVVFDFHSILQGKKKVSLHTNKTTTTCWAEKFPQSRVASKSTSLLPKPTADQASLVTTWLSVSLLKLLAMATVGCVNQANAAPGEKQWRSSPINATVCVGRSLWVDYTGYCSVGCDKYLSLDTWESDQPWCSKLCSLRFLCAQWKQCDPLGILFYKSWGEIMYCHCDGNCAGSSISDQNWIKKRQAAASRLRQVDSHCRGLTVKSTCEWMNESLLLCSFASLSFLDSFFPSGLLLRKNPSARLGMLSFHSMLPLKFQGTWMVPSSYLFLRNRHLKEKLKPNFNILYIFVKYVWISLPINAKKNLLQHLFFCEAYVPFGAPFGAQQWKFLSSLSIFVAFLE